MTAPIRILGIDPGLRHTGWGVIEQAGARLTHVAHGVIEAATGNSMAERLGEIFECVGELARHYQPDAAGVEETLVNANPRAALKLGQARGAAICAVVDRDLGVLEYSPMQIKNAVVGRGVAEKTQVQHMVGVLLGLSGKLQADAADALAVAITHAHSRGLADRTGLKPAQLMRRRGWR